jgi:hypothetical protein
MPTPTQQDIDRAAARAGLHLSDADRAAFSRGLAKVGASLPRPSRAAMIGAGVGAGVALLSGRSAIKYGLVVGGLGYLGVAVLDATLMGGYAMGFAASKGGT